MMFIILNLQIKIKEIPFEVSKLHNERVLSRLNTTKSI